MAENIDVRLGLDSSNYVRGAGKAAKATDSITGAAKKQEKGLKSLSAQYGGVAKAAAGAFAVKKVADFARSSVKAFSDLEESLNAVEVGFGAGADAIKTFGETAAESVGLSNAEFNQLSVTTGALMSNFIDDSEEAALATIELTERASDMASVFNTSVPDALNAVQSALRGESEPIRRFGVLLDEAAVKSRAMALGLADASGELDQQAKGLARLDLIYEQTNKTAGDFANTSEGLANKQRILAAQFEDAKAAVGEALAPAMSELLSIGLDLLPLLTDLGTGIQSATAAFGDMDPALQAVVLGIPALLAGFTLIAAHPVIAALAAIAAAFIVIGGEATNQAADVDVLTKSLTELGKASPEAIAVSIGRVPEKDIKLLQQLGFTLGDVSDLLAEGAFRNLTDEIGPSMGELVERFQDLKDAGVEPANSVGALSNALVALQVAYDEAAASITAADEATRAAAEGDQLSEQSARVRGQAIQSAGAQAARAAAKEAAAIAEVTEAAEEAIDPIAELNKVTRRTADSYKDAEDQLRSLIRAQAEALNPGLALITAQRKFTEAQANNTLVQTDATISADDKKKAMIALLEATTDLTIAESEVAGRQDEIWAAFQETGRLAGLLDDEIRTLAEGLGIIPTDIDVQIGVTTTYTQTGRPPTTVDPNTGGRTKLAHGGPANAGEPYIVGEQGPELFVPSTGGQVVPNNQLGSNSNTVQVFMEAGGDAFDDVSLALALSGITESIEVAGTSTLRG